MARRNTANQEMIREFAELKKKGITDFICTTINDITGKHLKPVMKHTAHWKTYCTYHA